MKTTAAAETLERRAATARAAPSTEGAQGKTNESGKLRIGDDSNAIRITALSQGIPLKAVAEFVAQSIDARAKSITVTRGREQGEHVVAAVLSPVHMPAFFYHRRESGKPKRRSADR